MLNLWKFFYLITYTDKILYPGADYGLPECKILDWASSVKCMYYGTGVGMGLEWWLFDVGLRALVPNLVEVTRNHQVTEVHQTGQSCWPQIITAISQLLLKLFTLTNWQFLLHNIPTLWLPENPWLTPVTHSITNALNGFLMPYIFRYCIPGIIIHGFRYCF